MAKIANSIDHDGLQTERHSVLDMLDAKNQASNRVSLRSYCHFSPLVIY